jgi:signal transduction histidine kinase
MGEEAVVVSFADTNTCHGLIEFGRTIVLPLTVRSVVTLVIIWPAIMNTAALPSALRTIIRSADPRRSQAAGALWLITALAVTFSIAAAVWVGGIARDNMVEQHERRLALETDQLSSDLSQAIAARLGAIRAAERLPGSSIADPGARLLDIFDRLCVAYPQFTWLLVADRNGTVLRSNRMVRPLTDVSTQPWFMAARQSPWLGTIERRDDRLTPLSKPTGLTSLGDMAAPLKDSNGRTMGILVTPLDWQRSPAPGERLTDETDPQSHTEASLLDRDGTVLVATPEAVGKPWSGTPALRASGGMLLTPHFERLPGGRGVLVARAPLSTSIDQAANWLVQLTEPNVRVYQRANALTKQILWVSIGLGAVTAMLGGIGAHQLTKRLKRLADSVARVKANDTAQIEVPHGIDEVAQLGAAFADLLQDLQLERAGLKHLSLELERRVAVRTGEVERLADEARYAAIVRERLKIARGLHDTLAHSMMAMLSEIRYLRRLQTHSPAALAGELARAEEVAHAGLEEARSAITQMRETAVRDTGLGPALSAIFERFLDSTGLHGEFRSDPHGAVFGDERAETLVRMVQEGLRNIERHAHATRVTLTLESVDADHLRLTLQDNGSGFDPRIHRAGHYGILGLHEQADLIGAQLEIMSAQGSGTTLQIHLRVTPVAFVGRVAPISSSGM